MYILIHKGKKLHVSLLLVPGISGWDTESGICMTAVSPLGRSSTVLSFCLSRILTAVPQGPISLPEGFPAQWKSGLAF